MFIHASSAHVLASLAQCRDRSGGKVRRFSVSSEVATRLTLGAADARVITLEGAAVKSLLMAVGLGEKGCVVDDNATVAAAAFNPHDSEDSNGKWDPACVRANTAVLLRLAKLVLQKVWRIT